MDYQSRKLEEARAKYMKLRKKVKDWEVAIFKTELRPPSKDDMNKAPKEVHEAYRNLKLLKKYIADAEANPKTEQKANLLTPGKLFFGSHRRELQRSDPQYVTRSPSSLRKSEKDEMSKSKTTKPTLGLRSFRSPASHNTPERIKVSDGSRSKPNSSSKPPNPFKKLYKVTEDTVSLSDSSSAANIPKTEVEDSGEVEVAPLPLAAKLSAKLLLNSTGIRGNSSISSSDNNSEIKSSKTRQNDENDETIPALKSPRFKNRLSLGLRSSTKKLDFGWLSRLNVDGDEEESNDNNPNLSASLDTSTSFNVDTSTSFNADTSTSFNVTDNESKPCNDDPSTSANSTAASSDKQQLNSSNDSMTFSEGNISGSMEVDRESLDQNQVGRCNENTDSGIGVNSNSMFSARELHQAVQEVLAETTGDQNVTVSDADGSLLYSLSEDACLPSDHEDYSLENTVCDIINKLSDDIGDNEESNSTHCESMEMEDDAYELPNTRKRSAKNAFSPTPSPEKKKHKFFKSTRSDRKFSLYSKDKLSYKPPSPKKRVTRSAKQKAGTSLKLVLKKVTTDDENSTQDVWTSNTLANTSTEDSNDGVKETETATTAATAGPSSTSRQRNPKRKRSPAPAPKASGKTKRPSRPRKNVNYEGMDNDPDSKTDKNSDDQKPKFGQNVVVDVFDEGQMPIMPSGGGRKKFGRGAKYGRKRMPETIDSKINSGRLDENFVRIDLKHKKFVRGHMKRSVTKMKRLEYKQRKTAQGKESSAGASTSSFTCYKCGEKGHFAKFCMKDSMATEELPPGEEDDSPLPTLEEAARMIYKDPNSRLNKVNIYGPFSTSAASGDSTLVGDDMDTTFAPDQPTVITPQLVETLEPLLDADSETTEYEEEIIQEGLQKFGYTSFRSGQREAISRVLKGLSTLLILSTGSGKSLCYQLPAYLFAQKYPGALTLCISPLVSLMEDQILGIPDFLNAACLHSNMSKKQKDVVMERLKSKKLNILLVSPEAVCGGLFGLFKGQSDTLPKISFACIDEVHCVSQWSHNFRPSYLQLCKILQENLNVKTILGLTATATKATAHSICEHLKIDPSTTIRGELIPRNLNLSVSRDIHKDESLISLLQGERFKDCDSIIIYCTRREECERIATLVRTKLQTMNFGKIMKTKRGARLSSSCEAYHAGMTSYRRKVVQDGFMSGDIRIVVATVAFGMGIDKSDIRAVIHYNMPSAFESYVQEIGRAGRDSLPAHCHLFLDNARRSDLNELKRHVYANSVDRPTIRKLLRKVFQSCKCKRIEKLRGNQSQKALEDGDKIKCQGHEVSFSIEKCVTDLDLPRENITTLLCYMELDEKKWIEMLPLTYEKCKIQSYGGAKLIKGAASRCPPLAVAIALLKEKNKFREDDPYLEFNVIEVAATVGWSSGVVKKELKGLEWSGSQFDDKGNPIRFRKSGLLVEFTDLAYRVKSRGSLSDEEADEVLNTLHNRNVNQEQTQIYQLHRVYDALLSVSLPNINTLCDSFDEEKSNELKRFIHEYFSEDMTTVGEIADSQEGFIDKVDDLRRTIRQLLNSNRDTVFTTRAVARILQGIPSPNFPADVWYKSREFWRKFLDVDFHFICKMAAEEM